MGILATFLALPVVHRVATPATTTVFTAGVQGSAMSRVTPAWNPVSGNVSTSNAHHDVERDATDLHVICHVKSFYHVAIPVLEYAERYAPRSVAYAMKMKSVRFFLEMRMKKMQGSLSCKTVATSLRLKI